MKIATFNVNGANARLTVLLRWLVEVKPDVVCLQQLKAPQEKFPEAAIREVGYGAIWHGQKSWNGVAILARGLDPVESRRCLPGDPDDTHSRYIEASICGVLVCCLYLPNGNPAPGPRFDYKLRWFTRLTNMPNRYATAVPVVLAGDYNVMPTELDVYKPERGLDDPLFRPEVRDAFARLVNRGWTDAVRKLYPGEREVERILARSGNSAATLTRSIAAMHAVASDLRGFCDERYPPDPAERAAEARQQLAARFEHTPNIRRILSRIASRKNVPDERRRLSEDGRRRIRSPLTRQFPTGEGPASTQSERRF